MWKKAPYPVQKCKQQCTRFCFLQLKSMKVVYTLLLQIIPKSLCCWKNVQWTISSLYIYTVHLTRELLIDVMSLDVWNNVSGCYREVWKRRCTITDGNAMYTVASNCCEHLVVWHSCLNQPAWTLLWYFATVRKRCHSHLSIWKVITLESRRNSPKSKFWNDRLNGHSERQ